MVSMLSFELIANGCDFILLLTVLGSFLSALNRYIADRYCSNHSLAEYHVYEFFKVIIQCLRLCSSGLKSNVYMLLGLAVSCV